MWIRFIPYGLLAPLYEPLHDFLRRLTPARRAALGL